MERNRFGFPELGLGLGLRRGHADLIRSERPDVGFFEVISENYLGHSGPSMDLLDEIAAHYPVVLHGVSLSLGSTDPLDLAYLDELRKLARRVRARWISDHVCWTGVLSRNSHDLLPLPLTEEALRHTTRRAREVSERLGMPIVLENPSSYLRYRGSSMSEAEFIARLAADADCALLLDINNVYVSSRNLGLDPEDYLDRMPADRVVQIHLAGYTDCGDHLLDTHSRPVSDPVWALYRRFVERAGFRPTMVEWDADLPDFETVWAEARRALDFVPELQRHGG